MGENLIGFDKLGIGPFRIKEAAFSIGSFEIYWYAIIIAIGIVLAVSFCMWQAKHYELTVDNVLDVLIFGLPIGVICARAYYVLFTLEYYTSFSEMLDIRNGGLAIYGGVIGAFITGAVYCKVKKANMLALFDLASFGFLIGQSVGRWGNFVNGEAYGGVTDLPWGMSINGSLPVHPTFLYESLWNIVGLVLLFLFSKYLKKYHGEVFFLYLAWYGMGRSWIEGLRQDSLYIPKTQIRVSQLLAIVLFAAGITLFILSRKNVLKKAAEKVKERKIEKEKEYKPRFLPLLEDASDAPALDGGYEPLALESDDGPEENEEPEKTEEENNG